MSSAVVCGMENNRVIVMLFIMLKRSPNTIIIISKNIHNYFECFSYISKQIESLI